MRLMFICGSLEAGIDGVGDYTRRLALSLIKQGHEIAALALNDQFVTEKIACTETSDNVKLQTYRIPSKFTSKNRFQLADFWIENFDPEWLSLQFVPFSFNTKGLPFRLGVNLSKLSKRKWHIMFHELWIGMEEESTLKRIIWGKIQKLLISSMVKSLNPISIHTQTKLYQIQLNKLNLEAKYLPLFSNIPKNYKRDTTKRYYQNKISFVNFGTIHPGASIENFARDARIYVEKTGAQIELIIVGRSGSEQENWVNIWKSYNLNILLLGEKSADEISEIFSMATFGITTTALPLVEKSGSIAAMHEHQLPVICVAKPWHPRGINKLPVLQGVSYYTTGKFELCIKNNANFESTPVNKIADMFVHDLKLF